jgi:hypothetical protein
MKQGLFQIPVEIPGISDDVQVDAAMNERYTLQSRVTEHPVEDGASISDHVIKQPLRIAMTGRLSNQTIGFILESLASVFLSNPFGPPASKQKWDTLVKLRDKGKPFTLVTGLDRYTDLVFESLEATRGPSIGSAIEFSAVMVQIEIASTFLIPLASVANGIKGTAQAAQSIGKRAGAAADVSILKGLVTSIAG